MIVTRNNMLSSPPPVHTPSGISIDLAVLAQLTVVTVTYSRPTHRRAY